MKTLDVLVRIPKSLLAQLTEAEQMPDFPFGRTAGWRETEEFTHTSIQMTEAEFDAARAAFVPPVYIIGVWDWETGRQHGGEYGLMSENWQTAETWDQPFPPSTPDTEGPYVEPQRLLNYGPFPVDKAAYLVAMPDVPSGNTVVVEREEPVYEGQQVGTRTVMEEVSPGEPWVEVEEPVYGMVQTGTSTVTVEVPDGVMVRPTVLTNVVLFSGQGARDLT